MEYYFDNGMVRDLSSGETEELEEEQNLFYEWMQDTDKGELFWNFDDTFADDKEKQEQFFRYLGEHVKSVPAYKYVLRYLMLRYKISIGEKNQRGLWKFLEKGEWKVNTKVDRNMFWSKLKREAGQELSEFAEEDYVILLSTIYMNLKDEYPDGLVKGAFTTYFYHLIYKFSSAKLKDMALVFNMDLETYKLFKMKVLRKRDINFHDHDEVMIYLTLKYASECGMDHYTAYKKMESMYPVVKMTTKEAKQQLAHLNEKDDSSIMLKERTVEMLEEGGKLKKSLKNVLFQEVNENLARDFENIDLLASAKTRRSIQKEFEEQWDQFFQYVKKYHQGNIDEKIREDKEHACPIERNTEESLSPQSLDYAFDERYSSELYNLDRHKVFRWLYGNNVEHQITDKNGKNNRINDLSDDEMVKLVPMDQENEGVYEDFFLDSQEFLDTRIRDNDFYAATFTKDETRQRNLLLTLGFLNYVAEPLNLNDEQAYNKKMTESDYKFKVWGFYQAMVDLLEPRGFMTLYSGNAYDTFLKMLLSSDNPLGLFHYIWSLKTNSED